MTAAASSGADLVFSGGTIVTSVLAGRETQAIAVRGGRVVAHGQQAVDMQSRARAVVDLDGRVAVPGLQDAHVHPVAAGVDMLGCDLRHCAGADAYVPALREWLDSNPAEGWIVATGWDTTHFTADRRPTARALDVVSTSQPVFLRNADGHSAWVNSRALEMAGITATTSDPDGGRIERDFRGQPNGVLHDGAMELVTALISPASPEVRLRGLVVAQEHLHSLGVVAWQDALVGHALGLTDPEDAYLRATASGDLTARVTGALLWDSHGGLDQADAMVERRRDTSGENYRATNVKFFLDGVPEAGTSSLVEPYCCAGPAGEDLGSGPTYYEPGDLDQIVTLLDAKGFGAHFHALGDRALRDALNAVQAARSVNGITGNRHQAAHVYLVQQSDLDRFAALDVIANVQMLWASGGDQTEAIAPFLGPERAGQQFPFKALLTHGATVCAGSDWPVSSPDPWLAIHVAVNRNLPGTAGAPLNPSQAITAREALHAYTAGSAHANGDPAGGTLEVGARADIAVLDRHPLNIDSDDLAQIKTIATYVDGSQVYSA